MSLYPFQTQPYSLAGAGALAGDVTIILKSMKDIDGNALTMSASFGAIGYGTLEPGNNTSEEQISFTGLTNNSNGTTTLTGVSSVTFQEPYTSTSGLLKSHAGSTSFIISNTSGYYGEIPFKRNNEAITGSWTVHDPVNSTEIANREWVLSVVNGGAVSTSSLIVSGTAGETVSAGLVLYFKVADGLWYKASSAASATTDYLLLGVAQGSGTVGNPVTGGVLLKGIDAHQTSLSQGTIYYLSTGGAISSSAGTIERAVGQASSTTALNFDPMFFYTPTALQKAALAGYRGTPSSTNTFLTSVAVFNAPTDQTQNTQNAVVTVGEADSTTKHNLLAQSFTPTGARIRGVRLYKTADTGSFTGTVTVALQANSAGAPSGSNLASVTISNADYEALGTPAPFDAIFGTEYTGITTGSLYWIVISTSTSDNANHPNVGSNSAGGYASGSTKYKNTTDGWVAIATIDLYFQTLLGTVGSIGTGDSNGFIPAEIIPFTTPVVNTYTSGSNTWTKPTSSNFKFAVVEVQGGGAGGGGASGSNYSSGGGAGGYVKKLYAASALPATVTATVGGAGAAGSSASGGDGVDSTFAGLTGSKGIKGVGGASSTLTGGAGGAATGGDLNIPGEKGGSSTGATNPAPTARGGSSQLGRGGGCILASDAAAGTGYGAGGGGACNSSNGGAGTAGIIIVTEYYI